MEFLNYAFEVNGFSVNASFDASFVRGTLVPLVLKLTRLQRDLGRKAVVFMAAPPAAGKSTLAQLIEKLSLETESAEPIKAIGMDGFHYPSEYISSHTVVRDGVETPLSKVKGGPESFDVIKLKSKLGEYLENDLSLWPFYDRRKHDAVDNAIPVDRRIILVEGNWMLLNDGLWRELRLFCDYSISIDANEELLYDRAVNRKIRGGATVGEAKAHYDINDGPNARKFALCSAKGDLALKMTGDGEYVVLNGETGGQ